MKITNMHIASKRRTS